MQVCQRERAEPPVRQRVRIRFCKQGDLRLIGHRDMVRVMERLFRRAELPLGMTQGFHPKPRMSFPAALALGIDGLDEVMEIELAREFTSDALIERLSAHCVPGLDFRRVEILPPGVKGNKARVARLIYQIAVARDQEDEIAIRVTTLLSRGSAPIERPGQAKPIELLEFLEELRVSEGTLSMTLRVTPQANPGPRDVLEALGLGELERVGARLRRTRVELEHE